MSLPPVDGEFTSDGICMRSSEENSNRRDEPNCPDSRRSDLEASSSSCSLFSFDLYPVKQYEKPWRIFSASVKGFVIGAGLRGGLALFAVIARLRRRQLLNSTKKLAMGSISGDTNLAVKETLRTARWRALLAGAIAGPSMLLTGLNTQHTSLAIYILMRAAVLAARCGIKSKQFGNVCRPLTWVHGDIFLLCLSSSQILMWTCFLFRIFKRCNIPMVAIGTFPTGVALAIEKKSRRIEISLYCLSSAIESFFTCMAEAGYMPNLMNLKRADVFVFSVSTAIIIHCYAIERDVFQSKYLNVLDWVFGVPLPLPEPTSRNDI